MDLEEECTVQEIMLAVALISVLYYLQGGLQSAGFSARSPSDRSSRGFGRAGSGFLESGSKNSPAGVRRLRHAVADADTALSCIPDHMIRIHYNVMLAES